MHLKLIKTFERSINPSGFVLQCCLSGGLEKMLVLFVGGMIVGELLSRCMERGGRGLCLHWHRALLLPWYFHCLLQAHGHGTENSTETPHVVVC